MAMAPVRKEEPIPVDLEAYEGDEDEAIENYYETIADVPAPAGVEADDWAE